MQLAVPYASGGPPSGTGRGPCPRDVLERGEGGSEAREGGLAGTPPPPRVPLLVLRRWRAKIFSASILLAPKAPKQNFGCQPQTVEGEGGGRGV